MIDEKAVAEYRAAKAALDAVRGGDSAATHLDLLDATLKKFALSVAHNAMASADKEALDKIEKAMNAEKVMALIASSPGVTDTELIKQTGLSGRAIHDAIQMLKGQIGVFRGKWTLLGTLPANAPWHIVEKTRDEWNATYRRVTAFISKQDDRSLAIDVLNMNEMMASMLSLLLHERVEPTT